MTTADKGNAAAAAAMPSPGARKPYTASAFQIHIWGVTGISYFFQYQLFAMVSNVFNLGFGLDPRIIGWALAFPRLIDAFIDPVVGHFSDITKTRWGRRRPFMAVCAILAAFLGMALWRVDPNWHWAIQLAYLSVIITVYFTVVMTFELTRNALSFELSDDYSIRSKIMAIASFWSVVPQVLGGAALYGIVVSLSRGDDWRLGLPEFRVGWALGLLIWVGGAALVGFLMGYVMLRSRPIRARWIGGAVVFIILMAIPPATAFGLHGVEGTRAMFHSWNPNEAKVAAPSTQPASTPASEPSTQAIAASQPASATPPATPVEAEPRPSSGPAAAQAQAVPASSPAVQTAILGQTLPALAQAGRAGSASQPAGRTNAAPAMAVATTGALTWGLDYPGHTVIRYKFPNFGTQIAAIRFVSGIVCIVVIVFAVLPTIFIKERFQNYNTKHVSLWVAIRATLKNKPFVLTIFLRLCQTLGTVLWGQVANYIIIFHVCNGDMAMPNYVLGYGGAVIGFIFTILIWPLAAPLTKVIGKRWGLILGFGSTFVSALVAPFIFRQGWIWVIFWNNFFWMPFAMMAGVFFESFKPDICDVDELQSGERREGLYSAVYSFINKLEISLMVLLSGYLLVWAGFDTKSASKGVMPAESVIHNLMWIGYSSLIFFAAAAFVITFFNPLTPKAMEKVHEELEKRRAATHVVPPELA